MVDDRTLEGVILGTFRPADHPHAREIDTQCASKIAAAIRERFDVREKVASIAGDPIPAPAVGQTWRNKQSDRLVKITEIDTGYNRSICWEALTGRGPKTGRVWASYWTSRYEFVAHAQASDTNDKD